MSDSQRTSIKKKAKKVKNGKQSKKLGKRSSIVRPTDGEAASHKLTHKEELAAIAKNDPEFYEFLQQQEADLLQFDESDIDSISADENDKERDVDVVESGVEETTHDNSFDQFDENGRRIVDDHAVNALREAFVISDTTPSWAMRTAVKAFMACVARVGANIEPPDFVIYDNKVFEEVVRLCFQYLGIALFEAVGPSEETSKVKEEEMEIEKVCKKSKHPCTYRFKRWKKWSTVVKQYIHALLLFLNEVQNADVIVCTLRTMAKIVELYVHFARLSRNLIRSVVRIWSRKSLECRIASMLVLCKIVRIDRRLYPTLLKSCYFAYVSNVREVTPETCPLILFMQKAFAEISHIYPAIAYPYAFVYIRQTAIHLRNAIIAKRKELIQTVYNWQFVQCLYLWANVIAKACRTKDDQSLPLTELVYPLSQITIATMRLFPSVKYVSLRLHCIRVLLLLQVNCDVYIPALSLAIQLLDDVELTLKKKRSRGKGTTKGIDMSCILRASSSQLEDAGFRQSMVEEVFRVQIEAAYLLRSSCAFPDIIHPLDGQIRRFVKSCRNVDYGRLMKSLSSKLNEHAKWVDTVVAARQVDLSDQFCLAALEASLSSPESPLAKFYGSWHKVWKIQQEATAQVGFVGEAIPKKENVDMKDVNERKAEEKRHNTKANVHVKIKEESKGDNDAEVGSGGPKDKITEEKKKRNLKLANKGKVQKGITGNEESIPDELVDFVMSDSE